MAKSGPSSERGREGGGEVVKKGDAVCSIKIAPNLVDFREIHSHLRPEEEKGMGRGRRRGEMQPTHLASLMRRQHTFLRSWTGDIFVSSLCERGEVGSFAYQRLKLFSKIYF